MTIDTERLKTDAAYWDECNLPQFGHYKSVTDKLGEKWISRPQAEWVDGLPPVGCECEVYHYEQWRKCEILAHRHGFVLYYVPGFIEQVTGSTSGAWFRPLRTKAQRDRDELFKIIGNCANYSDIPDAILSRYNLEPKP